ADVVEERGGDQRVGRAVALGERRGLQRVVELADGLVVAVPGPAAVQLHDLVDAGRRLDLRRGAGAPAHAGRPWKSPMSDTPVCSPDAARCANAASFSR